jgi:hypothetical protein
MNATEGTLYLIIRLISFVGGTREACEQARGTKTLLVK